MWGPPALGGLAILVVYVLGNLDVIDTPPAMAIDAFLLLAVVLFFPLRYAHRLSARGRAATALLAVAWLAVAYEPIFRRIYPGTRIATAEVGEADLPVEIPTAGGGRTLEMIIDGHLAPAGPDAPRLARYRLTIAAAGLPPQTFEGEFREAWVRRRRSRREAVEVHRERKAAAALVRNPRNRDLHVTALHVVGQAEDRLTLSFYPYRMPPLWLTALLSIALLLAAHVYDHATGAGATAASLTIATAATLTGAFAFPTLSSPHPSFRELVGAAIVGALVGGPIGGLTAWLLRGRLPFPAYRPRPRGR